LLALGHRLVFETQQIWQDLFSRYCIGSYHFILANAILPDLINNLQVELRLIMNYTASNPGMLLIAEFHWFVLGAIRLTVIFRGYWEHHSILVFLFAGGFFPNGLNQRR